MNFFRNKWFSISALLALDFFCYSATHESPQPRVQESQRPLQAGQETAEKVGLNRLANLIRRNEIEGYKGALLEAISKVSKPTEKKTTSVFKRVVKLAGTIIGSTCILAGGVLAYRYDIYGIGSVIGSYGSWWQGVKNWLGIRRIEQTQTEHTALLTDHSTKLTNVLAAQKEQANQLVEMTRYLNQIKIGQNEHGMKLEDNSKTLKDLCKNQMLQGEALKVFDKKLSSAITMLSGYGEQLTSMSENLKTVTEGQRDQSNKINKLSVNMTAVIFILKDLQTRIDELRTLIQEFGIPKERQLKIFTQLATFQEMLVALQLTENAHHDETKSFIGELNNKVIGVIDSLSGLCRMLQETQLFSVKEVQK